MADGTSFEIDIQTRGAEDAAAAAVAVTRLGTQLSAASDAAIAANAAVKAGESAYKSVQASADAAAKSLEKINQKVDEQRALVTKLAAGSDGVVDVAAYRRAETALIRFTQQQNAAAVKVAQTKGALDAEAASLDRLRAAASRAAAGQEQVSKSLDKARTVATNAAKAQAAAAGSGKINEVGEALGKLGGPLSAVGQKVFGAAEGFKKMSASLGSAGPYVAIAVALTAIAAGAVAATVALGAATISILKMAVANADAARTAKLLEEQAKGGAEGLAATQKLALSLDNQAKKLKDDLGKIFSISSGRLEVFLKSLAKLGELFDSNSITAKAMRVVFQSLFDPLIDGINAWIPRLVAAFIQFEILVLKALIAIKPFGSTILTVAKYLGIIALVAGGVLAVAIGILVAGFAAMMVGATVLLAAIGGLVIGLGYVVGAVVEFGAALIGTVVGGLQSAWAAFTNFYTQLQSMSLAEIGTAMINGLINGITNGAQAVISAITGVVGGAVNAAKSALGIASPSKVFAEIGLNTAAGMTEGVDDGASDVQGAMVDMTSPTAAAEAGAAAPAAPVQAGGGNTYQITISGVAGAEDIVPQLIEALEKFTVQGGRAVASA